MSNDNGTTDDYLQRALENLDAEVEEETAPEAEAQQAEENTEELSSDDQSESLEDASEAPDSEQAEEPQEKLASDELPEKWKGKSASDIAKAHSEAERRMHEIASEKAAIQRQLELQQQQLQQLQEAINKKQETDPIDELANEWDEDPVKATQNTFKKLAQKQEEERRQLALRQQAQEADSFVRKQREENADFASREQDMIAAGQQYATLFNPQTINSRQGVELLYHIARGMKVAEYEKAAVEKAKKETAARVSAKKKARSESSTSQPSDPGLSGVDDFMSMTPEEMAEELKKSARNLGRSR